MNEHETLEKNRRGWDAISAAYQAQRRISTEDVHYGPLAPGERELGLLGDVRKQRILEVGCGGGQNAVALARQGAICAGIDPSEAQLAHARRLAREYAVEIRLVQGKAEDLSAFPDAGFDIVLSSFAFDYVPDLWRAYREAWRVLMPGGLFVFCLSHPWFQAVGWHLAGDPGAPEVGNYAAWPDVEDWDWCFEGGISAPFRGHLRTLGQIVNELVEAGFILERLVEQSYENVATASPEELARLPYIGEFDPGAQEYQVMRRLPFTLLIRARKEG